MRKRQLSENEKIAWLRLIRSENVGPATLEKLMGFYEKPSEALDALPEWAARGGAMSKIKICPKNAAVSEIEKLHLLGGAFVCSCEKEYPNLLRQIKNAPPVLSVLGHMGLLDKKAVAFVGARNASLNGKNLTRHLAFECVENGLNVVSGMALGIDGAAHEGALASTTSEAGTIAVLGCGVDVVYPPEHKSMYDEIKERGAIVSDFPLSCVPNAMNFPRRNRVIAGLALGTLVIEAKANSGSLITARFAKEQNHVLMAVPGSPLDDRSVEPNRLIKEEGATMVQTAEDIFAAIQVDSSSFALHEEHQQMSLFHLPCENETDAARPLVLRALSAEPISEDKIAEELSLPNALVSVILLELELAGRLERHSMGRVSLLATLSKSQPQKSMQLFEE